MGFVDNPGVLEKFRHKRNTIKSEAVPSESKKNRKGRKEKRKEGTNLLQLRLLSLSLPPIKIKDLSGVKS